MRRTLPVYLPDNPDPHWVGECLSCGARTAPDPIRRRAAWNRCPCSPAPRQQLSAALMQARQTKG